MKKFTISILGIFAGISMLLVATAFIISNPKADFSKQEVNLNDQFSLSEIQTQNENLGTFKSSIKFKLDKFGNTARQFYGYEIFIADNAQVDRILIGVTSNLVSRVEIWKKAELVESKELGFMNKMTWGETQTLTVDFADQTNRKYKGKSKITMRFYEGTGFFGDIGTINFDLTKYGDLSGNTSIGVFANEVGLNNFDEPQFTDLKIWKNYTSFD